MPDEFELGGIEGGSASAPKLATISDRVVGTAENELTLPNPSGWSLRWRPVQSDNEAKDDYRTISRYRVGYRVNIEIRWDAITVAERAQIVSMICAVETLTIRCWPHEGNTNVYYDCLIAADTDVDSYVIGAPIGYTGKLVLVGKRVFEDVPIYEEVGDIDFASIKRGFCYSDSTQAPDYYDETDAVTCFTDSTTPAADYEADDKVGFHDRAVRDIGG